MRNLLLLTSLACGEPLGPLALPPAASVDAAWQQIGVPEEPGVLVSTDRSLTLAADDPAAVAGRIEAGLTAAGWVRVAQWADPTGQTQDIWYRAPDALAVATLPPPRGRVSVGWVAVPKGVAPAAP